MENLNDVNNLDPNDEGLKAVMGRRFHDETTGGPAPAKKAAPAPAQSVEAPAKKIDRKAPAKWAPPKPDPNWMDHLKAAAKWAATFGGTGSLFFYWQQTGLMDPAAAMPSIVVCALLTGLGIGKHLMK